MKCGDVMKKNVEELGGGSDWKARSEDREGWKAGCMIVLKAVNTLILAVD
jgi:hypothetical protein